MTQNNSGSSPSAEFVSLGIHEAELAANLQLAPYAQPYTQLLVDAGILPDTMNSSRIIPGITYGLQSTKPELERAELLTGTSQLMADDLGTQQFNPHFSLRTLAQTHVDALAGKGRQRNRGVTFKLPSYVIDNREGRHLFIGGEQSDLNRIKEPMARALSNAYNIGNIVVGGEVLVGNLMVNIGRTSLPSVVREIGKTIIQLSGSYQGKVDALKGAHRSLKVGELPSYRSYEGAGKAKTKKRS